MAEADSAPSRALLTLKKVPAHESLLQDTYGFCLVSGIPGTPEATEALIRRIAFIRETHYGGFWDFTANLEHGDLAYSDVRLEAHTDTTYFSDVRISRLHPESSREHSTDLNGPFSALRIAALPPPLALEYPYRRPQPPR